MAYTGLEFFMEKLEQMLYRNDNPLINNHTSILSERPQIQQLFEELSSMVQTLFFDDDDENSLYDFEQVKNLRRRFKDAAQQAQDMIDLFVFDINLGKDQNKSLNLEQVMREIKSIKVEFITTDNMKIDKSPCPNSLRKQSSPGAAGSSTTTRSFTGKKKEREEIVVGFDRDTGRAC